MDALIDRLCHRFVPGYVGLSDVEQMQQCGDAFGALWALPIAIGRHVVGHSPSPCANTCA